MKTHFYSLDIGHPDPRIEMKINSEFKKRLLAREPLLGAFIKTPHPIVVEIMGGSGFDFLVLDAEHAPIDRASLDTMLLAGRAIGSPLIVRVPSSDPAWVLNALDAGAAGVMIPHVLNAKQAARLATSVSYEPNGRGFAGTTRAAQYAKRSLREHLVEARNEVCLICQIEDPEGVRNASAIAAVPGADALFVGRADLAVSCGRDDFNDAGVQAMTQDVLGIADAATGLYCAPFEELEKYMREGASLFVVGSEHSLIAQAAETLVSRFKESLESSLA